MCNEIDVAMTAIKSISDQTDGFTKRGGWPAPLTWKI
jgi:hypothetical protein